MLFTKEGTLVETPKPYTTRTTCRACGKSDLVPILDLGDQYLPRFVKDIDLTLPTAPLELVRCSCGLLQLKHSVDPDLVFRQYWYQSAINQTMMKALTDLAGNALKYHREGRWLDIGANDGFTLSQVPPTFRRIACEPALNLAEKAKRHADLVVSNYFSADIPDFHESDVITSAAMFYDLDDPRKFVRDIVQCLTPDGVWINQLNDSPTMMEKNDFSAICHEHLTYWDIPTLDKLYRESGLTITDISHNEVNGGSVRITARKDGQGYRRCDLFGHKAVTYEDADKFGRRVKKWKTVMSELLRSIPRPIWVYGASTKGCVLLQYLEENEHFVGIADRNPSKFGLHMSGCWLPIVDETTMRRDRPDYLLILPWAFRKEFIERERDLLDSGTTMVMPLPNPELVL
jgi:C-methyltransferase-like protein/methyltransferase family protein/putative zinc binding protein